MRAKKVRHIKSIIIVGLTCIGAAAQGMTPAQTENASAAVL